jgi:hypothetical protein
MLAKMRENGMSEADIQERLSQFAQGGGSKGDSKGGGSKGGGKDGERSGGGSYVLVDSGNPDAPERKPIKTGISDGSYTEILEGLAEGDEVLIQKIKISTSKAPTTSSPFTPSFGGGRPPGGGGGSPGGGGGGGGRR